MVTEHSNGRDNSHWIIKQHTKCKRNQVWFLIMLYQILHYQHTVYNAFQSFLPCSYLLSAIQTTLSILSKHLTNTKGVFAHKGCSSLLDSEAGTKVYWWSKLYQLTGLVQQIPSNDPRLRHRSILLLICITKSGLLIGWK